MNSMKVLTLAEKLKKLYKIEDSTYDNWLKAVRPIGELTIDQVTPELVLDQRIHWLERVSESTTKTRLSSLKAIWNKGRKMKLVPGTKADNPWLDSDDGLTIEVRDPEFYPWEHYKSYHNDPYFVFLWFTGARIGEVAGLDPKNIVQDADISQFVFVNQENGILKNFMQDRLNARLMNTRSTGSGRRESYKHIVLPRMRNTMMLSGNQTQDEMIKSVDKGIFAVSFGGGQVDITSGKFVFNCPR